MFLLLAHVSAQECDLVIKGKVTDHETDIGLENVNVYVLETGDGAASDEHGHYEIGGLCAGEYHLVFSHIGCDPEQKYVVIDSSIDVDMTLEHSSKLLEGVVVTGHHIPNSTQNAQEITRQSIADNVDEGIADMLGSLSGVATLRNGVGIAKPVIHGLYGNRITILNNGIAQSGQQWGNDHSPEIDPMVANRLTVLKGVSALAYPGSNLGGVIKVLPSKVSNEPHLHGNTTLSYSSNGRAIGTNLQLFKGGKWFDWKLNGTYKKSGDRHTPNYFLTNTGSQELNFALQVEKAINSKFFTELYISSFNSDIGVLRGSHVGNLTDLEEAFQRDVPFFTSDTFSYSVDAPKQEVHHQLAKLNAKYFFTNDQWLEATYAIQYNNRKEFDVRRSGRSELPALSLQQYTHFGELKYAFDREDMIKVDAGLQSNVINNTNNPETGILPLIPDYLSYEMGSYGIITKTVQRSFYEFGLRYDFISQDVPTISNSVPREIIRYQNLFSNLSSSIGWKYLFNPIWTVSANIGFATRNPAINELYSGGLHQGVSGIEEGNINLEKETSYKSTLTIQANKEGLYAFDILFYYQNIDDYIYLKPTDEKRLTIRGAFPVFIYDQTNAEIFGLDFSGQLHFSEVVHLRSSISTIIGNDLSRNQPLIYIPSNRILTTLQYQVKKLAASRVQNPELELEHNYTFRQSRFIEGDDFLPPPDGYHLLNIKASSEVQISKLRFRVFLKIDNLLNAQYRDYLNRQRYFAEDIGRNITLGTHLKF